MSKRYFGGMLASSYTIPITRGDGTLEDPYSSPAEAAAWGAVSGTSYYFKSGAMTSAVQLEFQNNYYESKPFCRVFTSPYNGTATVNQLGLSIPMKGLLVQRDALDLRAAVYWNTATVYNATSGITADSGYAYRKVMLGSAGGHGIYNTSQNVCNWSDSVGAVGAGWNGSTCGSYPNGLIWGTGQSGTSTYTNLSGTWSHWIWWE